MGLNDIVSAATSLAGQGQARLELRAGTYLDRELEVLSFEGVERLNAPFVYDVTFATTIDEGELYGEVFGFPACLIISVPNHDDRVISGVAVGLEAVGDAHADDGQQRRTFSVRIAHELWLLGQVASYRVFQHASAIDIARALIAPLKFPVACFARAENHPPIPFMYQRGESDLAFLDRVLATAGIFYYFEHATAVPAPLAGGLAASPTGSPLTKLVLCDSARDTEAMADASGSASLPTGAGSVGYKPGDPLPYDADGHERSGERISAFRLQKQIRPRTAVVADWSPGSHRAVQWTAAGGKVDCDVKPSADGSQVHSVHGCDADTLATSLGADKLTVTEYQQDGAALGATYSNYYANQALAQLRSDWLLARGKSDCARLAPGYRFSLARHPSTTLNVEYLVTEVRSKGRNLDHLPTPDAEPYGNDFVCLPATIDPKPAKPAPLPAFGAEPAEVVGSTYGEIATDAIGQIQVRFRWGAESKDASDPASGVCRVQWLERWGGNGYGSVTIPRVGSEVWVEFPQQVGGQPVAVGQLYSDKNAPPFRLPGEASKVGIRTQSLPPNGSGYSEISIQDQPGVECVQIRAQADMNVHVVANASTSVGLVAEESVGTDRRVSVGGNDVVAVGADAQRTIAGRESVKVGAGRTDSVTGARTDVVAGDFSTTVVGIHRVEVTGDSHVRVDGDENGTVTGTTTTYLEQGLTATVGTSAKAAPTAVTFNGDAAVTGTTTIDLEAAKSIRFKVGSSIMELSTDGLTVTVNKASFGVGDTAKIVAKTLTLTATDGATVTSKNVTASGSGSQLALADSASLQGGSIKLASGSGSSASQDSSDSQQQNSDNPTPKYALRTTLAYDHFRDFTASTPERAYYTWLRLVFGNPVDAVNKPGVVDIPDDALAALRIDVLHGDLPQPTYELKDGGVGGHQGGYDHATQKITIDRAVAEKAVTDQDACAKLHCILREEFGHHIDSLLRTKYSTVGGDGPNDEGAQFAFVSITQEVTKSAYERIGTYVVDKREYPLVLDNSELAAAVKKYLSLYERLSDDKEGTVSFFGEKQGVEVGANAGATLAWDSVDKKSFGHESVERALSAVSKSVYDFSAAVCKEVYYGNWLRDNSQFIDESMMEALGRLYTPHVTSTPTRADYQKVREMLTWFVNHLGKSYFDNGGVRPKGDAYWQTTTDKLGVYRQDEHMDNPAGITTDKLSRYGAPFLPATTPWETGIDQRSGMKRYILGGDGSHRVASTGAHVRRYFAQAVSSYQSGAKLDAFRAFGCAMHALEDFYAHSNFLELTLIGPPNPDTTKPSVEYTYPWVGEKVVLGGPDCPPYLQGRRPLVTGTFGGLDTAVSLLGVLAEHVATLGDGGDQGGQIYSALLSQYNLADRTTLLALLALKEADIPARYLGEVLHVKQLTVGALQAAIGYYQGAAKLVTDWQAKQAADPWASDPTHSQLTKDHPDHPFHALAAHCAQQMVTTVGTKMGQLWADLDAVRTKPDPKLDAAEVKRRTDEVIDYALAYVKHPDEIRYLSGLSIANGSNDGPAALVRFIDSWGQSNSGAVAQQKGKYFKDGELDADIKAITDPLKKRFEELGKMIVSAKDATVKATAAAAAVVKALPDDAKVAAERATEAAHKKWGEAQAAMVDATKKAEEAVKQEIDNQVWDMMKPKHLEDIPPTATSQPDPFNF